MAGSIFLRKTETSVGEANTTVHIEIARSGSTAGPVTIQYGIFADTATPGADYIGPNGSVVMPDGASSVLVPITILNDALGEPSELFTFTLISTIGAELSAPRTNRITILDDETPAPPPPAEPPLVSPYDATLATVVAGLTRPVRFAFSPLDDQTMYIAEKDGMIRVADLETGEITTFLDLRSQVNNAGDRGLLDVALHPDFAANPYVYAFYVVDPPDAPASGPAGRDGVGNRYAHIVRYTADAATGHRTIVPGSETILVGATGQSLADISGAGLLDYTEIEHANAIASDRIFDSDDLVVDNFKQDYLKVDNRSHAGGRLLFGPDGMLYAFTGDGTSYDYPDPRTPDVQSLDSLSGKVLRIDPITGHGLPDNPFAAQAHDGDLATNRARVWQYGLRNPFSGAFDAEGNLFIADVGWFAYEEINMAGPGANFGWPYYEGADNGALFQTPQYRDFASAAEFYAAVAAGTTVITPAWRGFSHNTIAPGYQLQAIISSGIIAPGAQVPAELAGSFFFSDFVGGNLFAADTTNRADITFLADWPGDYGPIHMAQGPDGALYYAELYRGTIGRLSFATAAEGEQPSLSIAAATASAPEGNAGTTTYSFTITRTGATATPVTVNWSAAGAIGIGTAPADAADFPGGILPSGTASFAAGETKATITVPVAADTKGEQNERFAVTLANPTAGATIAQANALATIVNDDTEGLAILAISATGVTRAEGTGPTGATTPFTFTVTRTGVLSSAVSAEWSAAGVDEPGTVRASADDFADGIMPSGRISFAPGQAKATITAHIVADDIGELNERFAITLSDASPGATIGSGYASAAILNDDLVLSLLPVTVSQAEGDTGTKTFTFTATRAGTGPTATVDWIVQPYGADAADFVGGTYPGGSLTFGPSDTTRTITVHTVGDTAVEPDDGFKVALQVPSAGARIGNATATGMILGDDSQITIANWNLVGYETNETVSPYGYVLTRNGPTPAGQTVDWSVQGLAGPGTLPANAADFVGGVLPSGTVTWAEGETGRQIYVPVAPDLALETNERFQITLSNPTGGAQLGHSTARGIIMNDDARFTIGSRGVFAAEGSAGTTAMTFTVTRTGYLDTIAAVNWFVVPGTVPGTMPAAASDFAGGILPTGELIFPNGVTTQTLTVNIAADRLAELNESFAVTLFNGANGTVHAAAATAHGIITDDDTILGTPGNDSLAGTDGPDLFLLGQGHDTITGGDGRDQFRFLPTALGPANSFAFTDFSPEAGERLDLSRIDAIAGTLANDAFAWIGTAAFSGTPGELRWQDLGGGQLLVQGNVNADPAADLTITLAMGGPARSWWFAL